ncbi:MAG: ester cyclase [Chlamydiia bacterium]|nr:ester cyclase [Chlamydiia bacterium]
MQKYREYVDGFFNGFYNNRQNDPSLLSYVSNQVIYNDITGMHLGKKGMLQVFSSAFKAFPDMTIEIKQIDAFGNNIIASVDNKGTYVSAFMDPSKRRYQSELQEGLSTITPEGQTVEATFQACFTFHHGTLSHLTFTNFHFLKTIGYLDFNALANPNHPNHSIERRYMQLIYKLARIPEEAFTPKEVECFCLCLCGFSAKQIAQNLGNSYRTIETHLSRALSKIPAFSKLHALEMMVENRTLSVWQELANILLY